MDGGYFNQSPSGAGAVGLLEELPILQAGAVLALRLACEPVTAPARRDFESLRGGRAAIAALTNLCTISATYGRRPLMRHALACRCVGGDEACVAQIITATLAGDRDDAMMIASLIVRADMAPWLLAEAERAGVALAQMAAAPTTWQEAATVH